MAAGATTLSYKGKRVGTGYGKPWSDADIARVKELHSQGVRRKQIAVILGVKYERVSYLFTRLGETLTPRRYQGRP